MDAAGETVENQPAQRATSAHGVSAEGGCCVHFKGWLASFTTTELLLALLEALLLIIFFVFLVFLILHFLVCTRPRLADVDSSRPAPKTTLPAPDVGTETPYDVDHASESTSGGSAAAKVKCTWEPSSKTEPSTRYYQEVSTRAVASSQRVDEVVYLTPGALNRSVASESHSDDGGGLPLDLSDGEDADSVARKYVLALVKIKPPKDITFGCILTIISNEWTVTAASCIEAIEEVDSVDNFVMLEDYGGLRKGRAHAVRDVVVHPSYAEANGSFDLAALRAGGRLAHLRPPRLPGLVDYFRVALGERFLILGFGGFRTIDRSPGGQTVRAAPVYALPARQCAAVAGGEAPAPRHLIAAAPAAHGACAAAPLCAGVLYSRGVACNFCAGAPLVRGGVLFGVMADNQQCGVACEPALYVNVAVAAPWLKSVVG